MSIIRNLIIVILLLAVNCTLNAQKFSNGIHLGINGSQVNGDDMGGFNKGGLLAGIFVEYRHKPKITWSFELNYTEKGSRRIIDEFDKNPGIWNLYKLSYLEVPLIFKYKFLPKFDVELALAYGLLVHQKYIDRNGTEDPEPNYARGYDANAFLGVTYHLSKSFSATARIQSSFVSVGKGKSNPIWSNTNTGLINLVTSFDLKYYLPMKRK